MKLSEFIEGDLGDNVHRVINIAIVTVVAFFLVTARWTVVGNVSDPPCLTYDWFIVDKWDRTPEKGAYFGFFTIDIPKFENGMRFVKIVGGVPGDRYKVEDGIAMVNSDDVGHIHPDIAEKLTKKISDFDTESVIPAGKYYMQATHERSYDSRYWGVIAENQLMGRAYPIW